MARNICSATTYNKLKEELASYKAAGIKIDMRRGRPDTKQLSLSDKILKIVPNLKDSDFNGSDLRNYGGSPAGLMSARRLFAEILDVKPTNVFIGGNSSLNLMYDCIVSSMLRGVLNGKPWAASGKVKFICPAPGYDRHFLICEKLGIEMITVKMNSDGPDMDAVEKLVSEDASIKGMWCVPQYSNPTGITFSDEVVLRIASMKPAADNFRLFWDNSYCIHHLYSDDRDCVKNIITACEEAGNPDMVYEFASTSKVTYAGSGLAVIAASENNIKFLTEQFSVQTIGFDKINQQKHVDFLKDKENTLKHMEKHAKLIRPKFETVLKVLAKEIKDERVATWSNPKGGYFISLNIMSGCAKKAVAMAADTGVFFTEAGATFPYRQDPDDCNIRIAPTVPSVQELKTATKILCICAKIAAYEKLL